MTRNQDMIFANADISSPNANS